MPDETTTQPNGSEAAPTSPTTTTQESPPEWAKPLIKQVLDLNAELGRLKQRDREPPKTGKDEPAPKTTIDPNDLNALIEARAILRTMKAEARAKYEPLIEGLPAARQLQFLEALAAQGSGDTKVDPQPAPAPGTAPSVPVTRTGAAHPRSMKEALALAKSDPARWQALKTDPTFDIGRLPQV